MNANARQRMASLAILGALLLSVLPPASWLPQELRTATAQAEGRHVDKTGQTSADASQEIVYLDKDGFVRVLDVQSEPNKEIKFVSPEGAWRNLALGDFNNDGDMEIVVVKGSNENDSVVAIYDPVVASGQTVPGQEFNGIPWKQLARFSVADRPEVVAAGNFDPNVTGDEFMFARETRPGEAKDDNDWRVVVYHQNVNNGDGTNWVEHTAKNFSNQWERIAVGNIDNAGGDEAVFIESGASVEAYQIDQNWRRIFQYGSDTRSPKDATLGQFFAGYPLELLMVRKQKSGQQSIAPAFMVFQYSNGIYPEDASFLDKFEPEPQTVFMGDINGSGDQEAILIRNLPDGTTSPKRLFVRGNGDDQIINEFLDGLPLADDNGYREGAAGDIDGDGKDEIVIIRDNNIRYYPNANTSAAAVDYSTTTNRRSIAIGDLDAGGSSAGPIFATDVEKLELEVNYGFVSTGQILLKNGGSEEGLPFFAAVDGSPQWLQISPMTGVAPGKSSGALALTYTVDARNMVIGQTYPATIRIQSNGTPAASNSPFLIPVTIKVNTPPFEAVPAGVSTAYVPCAEPLTPRSLTLTISGLPGSQLRDVQVWDVNALAAANLSVLNGELLLGSRSADGGSLLLQNAAGDRQTLPATGRMVDPLTAGGAVQMAGVGEIDATDALTYPSQVPWITSIRVTTTTLPTELTLTVDPALRSKPFEQAGLVLIGPSNNPSNPIAVRSYSVVMVCSDFASWLPVLKK